MLNKKKCYGRKKGMLICRQCFLIHISIRNVSYDSVIYRCYELEFRLNGLMYWYNNTIMNMVFDTNDTKYYSEFKYLMNSNDLWLTYVIFHVWSIFINNSDQRLISFTILKSLLFVSQLIGLLFLTQANRLEQIFCFKPKYKHNVVTHKLNNYAILHLLFAPQITFFVSTQTV